MIPRGISKYSKAPSHETTNFEISYLVENERHQNLFLQSRAYALITENGKSRNVQDPRLRKTSIMYLQRLILDKHTDEEHRRAASAIFIAVYCGVPYHSLANLRICNNTGFLKYHQSDFLPYRQDAAQIFREAIVTQGVTDERDLASVSDMLKVVQIRHTPKNPFCVVRTFQLALFYARRWLPDPVIFHNVLRSANMPRSLFYPQRLFAKRVMSLEASDAFKAQYFLPWVRSQRFESYSSLVTVPSKYRNVTKLDQ